jgi:hypothetical protein
VIFPLASQVKATGSDPVDPVNPGVLKKYLNFQTVTKTDTISELLKKGANQNVG